MRAGWVSTKAPRKARTAMSRGVVPEPLDVDDTPAKAFWTLFTTTELWPSRQPGTKRTTDFKRLKLFSLVATDLDVVCFRATLVRPVVWAASGVDLRLGGQRMIVKMSLAWHSQSWQSFSLTIESFSFEPSWSFARADV